MFLPERKHFLQRDIIDLLENETDFITMQEIADRLKYPSLHAVKRSCHIMREFIQKLYATEKLEMIISTHSGVRIKRQNTNLRKLTESINNEVIAYHLILQLLEKRTISVNDYCEENYISKSTLLRQAKRVNQFIHEYGSKKNDEAYHYKITITAAESLKILGEESNIRILHYFILKSSFDSLERLTAWQQMLKLTEKIFAYLKISVIKTQVRQITFWTYACQTAIEQGFRIKEDDAFSDYITYYNFAAKPDFLADWQEDDWQLFLLFLYSLEALEDDQVICLGDKSLFQTTIDQWFESFQSFFFTMDQKTKKQLKSHMQQQLQYCLLTSFDLKVGNLIETPRENFIKDTYPIYYQNFQIFWENFSKKLSEDDQRALNCFYAPSLYNCVSLSGLAYFTPTISFCLITETTRSHEVFMAEIIRTFCARFKMSFVADYHEADLIVATIAFSDPLADGQELLTIRTSLPNNDLNLIYKIVQRLTSQKRKSEI